MGWPNRDQARMTVGWLVSWERFGVWSDLESTFATDEIRVWSHMHGPPAYLGPTCHLILLKLQSC